LRKHVPFRSGPRTIDLDLLLYDELVLPSLKGWQNSYKLKAISYKLIVPHPRMHLRRFVLEPLCDLIDPQGKHPVLGKTWQELLEKTEEQRCDRIALRL
jgi:7,8-dihydro-6-hydroxymethylpterin-pyrophosphokinase